MTASAMCMIRPLPHYRREAFFAGLERAGFKPGHKGKDLLIVWNRYGQFQNRALAFEARGAAVIVAENGYLPMRGTDKAFALALGHHNGAGRWPRLAGRAPLLDIELKPWRDQKGEILILPQRGIGPPGVAMPRSWPDTVRARLTGPIRVRRHPGRQDRRPVEKDLKGVRCAVTWGSGAALKAICAGVPVFHDFPRWIGRRGACSDIGRAGAKDPVAEMGDRAAMLDDVASAQWTVEEVITGEPFRRLMDLHEDRS